MAIMALSEGKSLAKYLECSICLQIFDDPKQLTCHHIYCKGCLNDILEFKDDGSAVITCPVKCAAKTIIAKDKTTNDLGVAYEFKGLLESYKKDKDCAETAPLCKYESCPNPVSTYCCGYFRCTSCYQDHKGRNNHQSKNDEIFDAKNETLKVICEKHLTKCSHICSDETLLCIYCVNRTHRNHSKEDIRSQVTSVKKTFLNDSQNIEKLKKSLIVTKESIATCESKLEKILKQRRESCLTKYIEFLRKEEDSIKTEFKREIINHLKQYPFTCSTDYEQSKCRDGSIKPVVEKEKNTENIAMYNFNELTLQCITVSLTQIPAIRQEHPLGTLHFLTEETYFCDINPTASTFKDCFIPLVDNTQADLHTDTDTDTYTDTETSTDTDTDTHSYTDTDTESRIDTITDTHTHSESQAKQRSLVASCTETEKHAKTQKDIRKKHRQCDTNTLEHTKTDADEEKKLGKDRNSDTESDTDAYTDTNGESCTDTDSLTNSETETDTSTSDTGTDNDILEDSNIQGQEHKNTLSNKKVITKADTRTGIGAEIDKDINSSPDEDGLTYV